MIRPRGGTTQRGGDGQDPQLDESSSSVGTRLRQARDERGLDLLSVHDRLGRPITQIEALERDDHAGLPDETLAISTLRHYANLLGLDGDALQRQWSTERTRVNGDLSVTRAVPAVSSVVAAVTTGPDHLRAFTETGEVPQVGGRVTSASGASGNYDYKVDTGPPTGTFPVVPRADLRKSRRTVAKARRRLRAPRWLKVLTWMSAVLVLVVAAGWVLLSVKPTMLANAHILRVVPPGSPSSNSGGTIPRSVPVAGRQAFPVVPAGTSPSGTSYTVASSKFTVVVATSDRCWVQVTSSTSPVPLLSGVQDGGKLLSFPATGSMTVEVGSSAVLIGVTIKGKNAFTNIPTVVPFTYTFTSA